MANVEDLKDLEDLFDPDKPLPDDVVFIDDRAGAGLWKWVGLIMGIVLGGIAISGIGDVAAEPKLKGILAMAAIDFAVFVSAFLFLRSTYRNHHFLKEIEQGRYRYGLFFLNEHLVMRKRKECHVWHIDDVIECGTVLTEDRQGTNLKDVILTVRNPDLTLTRLRLDKGYTDTAMGLARRINRWKDPVLRNRTAKERDRSLRTPVKDLPTH